MHRIVADLSYIRFDNFVSQLSFQPELNNILNPYAYVRDIRELFNNSGLEIKKTQIIYK